MNPSSILGASFIVGVGLAAAPALAQEAGPAPSSVLVAEDDRFGAMVRGDAGALEPMLDDELVYAHSTGRVEDKERLLERIATGALDFVAIDPRDRRVRKLGKAAVVTGEVIVTVSGADGERVFPNRYLAVYEKRDEGWTLVAWQTTALPE